MLAHYQGSVLNVSTLARALEVSARSIGRYLDMLVDLMLVRRLPPLHANLGKWLVKSPKMYVRDSGLVHALLGISDLVALSGHPVVGHSWEGFVFESLMGGLEWPSSAISDLKPARAFVVHAEPERYPILADIEAIGLREMMLVLEGG